MKRALLILAAVGLLAAGILVGRAVALAGRGSEEIEMLTLEREPLDISVQADGVITANQSADLSWKTSGTVAQVAVEVGQAVEAGDVLAELETTSLPQEVILARAELLEAQRSLEDLRASQTGYAQALKALEDAEQALQDGRDPAMVQAEAQDTLAQAQKAVEDAERNLAIVTKRPPQSAIDQAYANLLLAENKYERTKFNYDRLQRRVDKPPDQLFFFEDKSNYRKILRQLDVALAADKRSYEEAQEKYNALLQPVDPLDKMVAEGNLALAQAQLEQAQREYERVKDGLSPADLAVLEAQLEEARRELARWQEGPDPVELAAAQARLASARSAIERAHILAPFDGVITAVSAQVGDRVSADTPAFQLADLQPLYADLLISEIEIPRVRVGQQASLRFESAPGLSLPGEVVQVSDVGTNRSGVVSFAAKVELKTPDERVRPGMTTTTTIVINALEDVLSVPNRAIRFQDGERVVYKRQSEGIIPVQVSLGASSETHSQVLEGDLQPGDVIILNPDADVLQAASGTGGLFSAGGGTN